MEMVLAHGLLQTKLFPGCITDFISVWKGKWSHSSLGKFWEKLLDFLMKVIQDQKLVILDPVCSLFWLQIWYWRILGKLNLCVLTGCYFQAVSDHKVVSLHIWMEEWRTRSVWKLDKNTEFMLWTDKSKICFQLLVCQNWNIVGQI